MTIHLKSILLSVLAAWLCLCSASSFAAGILDKTSLLGLAREEVEPALAGVQQVRAPRRLPSGATGQLHQADVLYEGAHFEQTFFFAQQKLKQIEMISLPGQAARAGRDEFSALLASIKAQLGPELASGDSASWVHEDADILLYRYGRPDSPTVRLVIRQRQLVDAGEL